MTKGRFLVCVALLVICLSSTGCASVFYPGRSHIPHEDRDGLDWGMFFTNIAAFWLFSPIAITIDFITGSAYLPRYAPSRDLPLIEGEE